ncbi:BTB/POZ domain-containing protein KCTD7 isoform X2 [Hyla sarda]|uniref:BTB/POZ domain-containing protein KCTD7 isoform X2 n=1 Tax=Hyla sarda TaxID=327740 RepID=UPI0024C37173|nr:BTB/POZ domain-containing protein KCTD7 isoform X2 [Hyla sarda]
MVVVSGQFESRGTPDDAMSSSDAEDELIEPATPTPSSATFSLHGKLPPLQLPEVIPLSVGGTCFTTRLSTLQSDILNFLRCGELPPRNRVKMVYKEAQYYSIGPLLDLLDKMQPLTGEKVRQAFLDLMPYYNDHLERIIEIGKLRAIQRKARFAKLKVCVFKEEMPITPYECPQFNTLRFERSESESKHFEHHCDVDVSFGPWEAVADVYDLLHCIVGDLSERGITVEHQCIGVCDKHLVNHYYCKRPIYEFKITWW